MSTNDTVFPPELTAETVAALLGRCRAQDQSWDIPALAEARPAIRYLLGQLELVHQKAPSHPVDPAFCRRYDGAAWTEQPQAVMDLLSLGLSAGILTLQQKGQAVAFPADLTPTLSPADPAFAAWYEGERSRWQSREKSAPADPEDASPELREQLAAARAGDASAQYRCGAMLYQGTGTTADPAAALYWLERAAAQGDPDAQCNCGTFYYRGIGTEPDALTALLWLERAARQGSATAQYNCGLLYSESCVRDPRRALYWYEQAAAQGNPDAQCNCGTMYFNGQGAARDVEKARAWFEKAAAQGDEFAAQVLREHFAPPRQPD